MPSSGARVSTCRLSRFPVQLTYGPEVGSGLSADDQVRAVPQVRDIPLLVVPAVAFAIYSVSGSLSVSLTVFEYLQPDDIRTGGCFGFREVEERFTAFVNNVI